MRQAEQSSEKHTAATRTRTAAAVRELMEHVGRLTERVERLERRRQGTDGKTPLE